MSALSEQLHAVSTELSIAAGAAETLERQHAAELSVRDATIAGLRAELADVVPPLTAEDLVYFTQGAPLRPDDRAPGYGAHERVLGISNQGRDWSAGSIPKVIPPYPRTFRSSDGTTGRYTHHNVWGEAAPSAGGMDPAHRDVRIQVAVDHVGQVLPDGTWKATKVPAAGSKMDGAYWNGGDKYSPTIKWTNTLSNPHWRVEADGWSISCLPMTHENGTPKDDTAIAHWFWPATYMPRVPIAPGAHVVILGRMRLIPGKPGVDVDKARFTACMSGDAYTGPRVAVGTNGRNPSLTHPRHLALGSRWRRVGLGTGTPEQIRAYARLLPA